MTNGDRKLEVYGEAAFDSTIISATAQMNPAARVLLAAMAEAGFRPQIIKRCMLTEESRDRLREWFRRMNGETVGDLIFVRCRDGVCEIWSPGDDEREKNNREWYHAEQFAHVRNLIPTLHDMGIQTSYSIR